MKNHSKLLSTHQSVQLHTYTYCSRLWKASVVRSDLDLWCSCLTSTSHSACRPHMTPCRPLRWWERDRERLNSHVSPTKSQYRGISSMRDAHSYDKLPPCSRCCYTHTGSHSRTEYTCLHVHKGLDCTWEKTRDGRHFNNACLKILRWACHVFLSILLLHIVQNIICRWH